MKDTKKYTLCLSYKGTNKTVRWIFVSNHSMPDLVAKRINVNPTIATAEFRDLSNSLTLHF